MGRTRILTEARIRALSDGSLARYYRAVRRERNRAHDVGLVYCRGCVGKCRCYCEPTGRRELTDREVAAIRALDFAVAACRREFERRA